MSSYDATILADSPAAYWPLADPSGTTATDLVGSNPGTYAGTFTLGQSALPLFLDGATLFDGTNTSQVSVPNSAALAITGNLTVECWVKITSGSGITEFLTKPFTSHTNPFFDYALSSGRSGKFEFFAVVGTTLTGVLSTTSQATGKWYHIVGVYDGAHISIYLNGVLDCTPVALTGTLRSTAQPLYIGGPGNWTGENFPGTIAAAAVYPSALTAAQIAAHYTAAGAPSSYSGRTQRPRRPAVQSRWRSGLVRAQTFPAQASPSFVDPASFASYTSAGTVAWGTNAYGPCMAPNDSTGQGGWNLGKPIANGATEFTLSALALTDTMTGGASGLRHLWGEETTTANMRLAFSNAMLAFQVGADGAFTNLTVDPPPLNVPVLITCRLTTAGVRSIWYGPVKVAERTDSGCAWGSGSGSLGLGSSVSNTTRNWSGQISGGHAWNTALSDAAIIALASDFFAPVRSARPLLAQLGSTFMPWIFGDQLEANGVG